MTQIQTGEGFPFQKREMRDLCVCGGSPATAASARRSSDSYSKMLERTPRFQQWRENAHAIKRYAIQHLDQLLVQFEQNLQKKGVEVLWAKDAAEANQLILEIAKKHHVKKVVKSKSLVSEELQLNNAFRANGIESIETDLGEFIIQLAGQRPTHVVIPALHLTAEQIGHLFEEKLGEKFTAVHEELTAIARKHLRNHFLTADMGISGINFGFADTGSFTVIENEGNAGLSTSTPPVHVAIMGIEKVISSVKYLPYFLSVLPRSATDQKLTAYTHIFHGPTAGRKMYVVLIDNGRTNVLEDPFTQNTLYCIRCGACMNSCPIYHRVGGWAYGWIYPGPIGEILNPHLCGMEAAGKLPFASSLCEKCAHVCPVKINIPEQLVHLRHVSTQTMGSPMNSAYQRLLWKTWSFVNERSGRFSFFMGLLRLGARFAPLVPKPFRILEFGAWSKGRAVPVPQGKAFRKWWKKNRKSANGNR
ncbi:MAG: lactate utilization protein [Thermoguttaceae bacterium]|nr:lactate utilization protein [Thermoguttaceae bacterium]